MMNTRAEARGMRMLHWCLLKAGEDGVVRFNAFGECMVQGVQIQLRPAEGTDSEVCEATVSVDCGGVRVLSDQLVRGPFFPIWPLGPLRLQASYPIEVTLANAQPTDFLWHVQVFETPWTCVYRPAEWRGLASELQAMARRMIGASKS